MTDELAQELATRLRDAHRRLASADLSEREKARVARRLIALSDVAKTDIPRAAARLERVLADLDGR